MPRDYLIGCCGWAEAQKRYIEHFPVVELQSTFYELPAPAQAVKWRALAPSSFEICMKAPQLITHTPSSPTYRRLKSPIDEADRNLFGIFRDSEQVWHAWQRTREIAILVDAVIVLFQCPASFKPSAENIENFRTFFRKVDSQPFRMAWEPRGPSWPIEVVRELCAEFNLIHCVDPFQGASIEGDIVYWRLHGRNGYFYTYSDEEILTLRDRALARIAAGQRPVYVMFNNTSMKNDALRLSAALAPV